MANYAQFLLIQADFFADGSCAVWHIKELLSLYNGQFLPFVEYGSRKIFKKYAPLLLRKRERVVSADMRFERVASTSGVRTHRKNERFSLSPELLVLLLEKPHTPFMSKLKRLPELFREALAFIRFDDYNYIVIL